MSATAEPGGAGPAPAPGAKPRSPDEIRTSIEANRAELAQSVGRLHGEVVRITDWRGQLERRRPQAVAVAAVAGFVIGGGLAAVGGALFGRRR